MTSYFLSDYRMSDHLKYILLYEYFQVYFADC